jgi:hypothetical protein
MPRGSGTPEGTQPVLTAVLGPLAHYTKHRSAKF